MYYINQLVKFIFLILAVSIILAAALYGAFYSTGARLDWDKTQPDLLITNITIITADLNQPEISNQNVLIQNGKITKISSDLDHFKSQLGEVKFIDGNGKFLMSGIIDAHAHIEDSAYLTLGLSKGVTLIKGMRGNQRQLAWRNEINKRQWYGSRFLVSSPILDGVPGDPFHHYVDTPQKAKQAVTKYRNQGYDYIKIYGDFEPDVYMAIVEQAKKLNIEVSKHGPVPVDGLGFRSLRTLSSMEHIEDIFAHGMHYKYDQEELERLALHYLQLQVPIVTTLAVYEELTLLSSQGQAYLDKQALEYMNPAHLYLAKAFGVNRWLDSSPKLANRNKETLARLLDITKFLHDARVKLLVGSDSGALIGQAGIATIREIELLVAAGISRHSALIATTYDNAVALGIDQKYGSVEEGKIADLLLLPSNPLKDLSALHQIESVIFDGQLLDQNKLEALKTNALEVQNGWFTFTSIIFDAFKLML